MMIGSAIMLYNSLTFDKQWPTTLPFAMLNKDDQKRVVQDQAFVLRVKIGLTISMAIATTLYFLFPSLYVIFFIIYASCVIANVIIVSYHIIYLKQAHASRISIEQMKLAAMQEQHSSSSLLANSTSFELSSLTTDELLNQSQLEYNQNIHAKSALSFPYSPRIATTYLRALAIYGSGFFLWCIENAFCSSLPSWLYLHAVWHLAAGYGTYLSIQCQMAMRAEYCLHKEAKWAYDGCIPLLPYVSVQIRD
jgi:hypothetical protein